MSEKKIKNVLNNLKYVQKDPPKVDPPVLMFKNKLCAKLFILHSFCAKLPLLFRSP